MDITGVMESVDTWGSMGKLTCTKLEHFLVARMYDSIPTNDLRSLYDKMLIVACVFACLF